VECGTPIFTVKNRALQSLSLFLFFVFFVFLSTPVVAGRELRCQSCHAALRLRNPGDFCDACRLPEAISHPLLVPAWLTWVKEGALVRRQELAAHRADALVGPALGADVHRGRLGATRVLVAHAGIQAEAETTVLLHLLIPLEVAASLLGDLLLNLPLPVGLSATSVPFLPL